MGVRKQSRDLIFMDIYLIFQIISKRKIFEALSCLLMFWHHQILPEISKIAYILNNYESLC